MERYDFTLNADVRDMIIFGEKFEQSKYPGGVRRFERLSITKLKELNDLGFLDMDERQNGGPTIKKIFDFMNQYPQVCCGGYTVSPFRSDYRISIDELICERDIDTKLISEFASEFFNADEFSSDESFLRAWWD
jgi:hypothetical protein